MKYRNEWKYLCNNIDYELIDNKLSKVLNYDMHANKKHYYTVHSLYFDDYKDNCLKDNDAGLSKRYKWRIRYYDNNTSVFFLERKEKLNGMCRKKSAKLDEETYHHLIQGEYKEVFWKEDNNLIKQFCIEGMVRLFKPKVIVDYERVAYIEPITNIRITFDKNVSASKEVDKFNKGGYTKVPILNTNNYVFEVKFDDILPSHIKKTLYLNKLQQTTFSKYYLSRLSLGGH